MSLSDDNTAKSRMDKLSLLPEILRVALGMGCFFAWPWTLFFGQILISPDLSNDDTITIWAMHLLVSSLTILIVYCLLAWKSEFDLGGRLFTSFSAALMSVGTIGISLVSYLIATDQAFFPLVIFTAIASIGFGCLNYAWGEIFGKLDVRSASIMIPAIILTAIVIFFLVNSLVYYIALFFEAFVITLYSFYRTRHPLMLSSKTQKYVREFSALPFNDILFRTNGVFVYLSLVLLAAAAGYLVPFGDIRTPMTIILQFAGVGLVSLAALLFVALRKTEISLGLAFCLSLLFCLSGLLLNTSSPGQLYPFAIAVLFAGWTFFEHFYWMIYTGKSEVNHDSRLLVFGRTRFAVMGSMAIGVLLGILTNAHPGGVFMTQAIVFAIYFIVIVIVALLFMRNFLTDWTNHIKKERMPTIKPPDMRVNNFCNAHKDEFALTAREKEIACYLLEGRTLSYIEEVLVVSNSTAKTHVRHIYSKLGIHNRMEFLNLFTDD